MQVREGYKQTEIGLIPNDWKVQRIGDVCDILDNLRKPLSSNVRADMKGEVPYYGANGVVDYINDFIFEEELILMAEDGGPFAEFKTKPIAYMIRGRSWVNNHAHILKAKENNNIYIYYNLVHKDITSYINGGTRAKLNKSELIRLPIAYPSLHEQQKIAEILSTVDAKLDAIDAEIEQTRALKKGLMQTLLTQGIGHTQFKDSPLGLIPESWEVVKLEDVTEKIGDGIHSTPVYSEQGTISFINGNNLVNGKIQIFESTKKISDDEYKKHKFNLTPETILLSINGTIGNIAYYAQEQVLLGKSAAYINPSQGFVCRSFLYYYIQSSKVQKFYDNELTGTTIRNLSLKSIRNTLTALPLIEEQIQIANILSTVDDKIDLLQQRKVETETLKKGLMQKLLTGEVRVKVA